MPPPLRTLLVANRGEIACRIMRTARTMGLATVAVHSDADASSPHVAEADLAVRLPGTAPADTYLRIDLLLEAARSTGADTVHPGYGFLSESADFARAVLDAGLRWVGPPPSAIEAMGSKTRAKELMREAGVPTLPSVTVGGATPPEEAALDALGWPLLVKASAGGGGRGMRLVERREELDEALTSSAREAASAFGDGTVFLERYLPSSRHIEVQVLADTSGDTVALFERECSIQRRHQKILEEAPSTAVGPELRARLAVAAVAAARAVGYVNAGTVEFVLDSSAPRGPSGGGDPFFLEMNTRLQVEHTVTEAVTGLDLVRLQLLIACGAVLPEAVHQAVARGPVGHAIEARLYAEDPTARWRPSTGRLYRFAVDTDRPGVRVDSGVETGDEIGPHYDPLLAKVIAHAATREESTAILAATLSEARLHGVTTNRDLLVRILRHPEFASGEADTGFLDRHGLATLAAPLAGPEATVRHAVAAALAGQAARRERAGVQLRVPSGWRNNEWDLQRVSFDKSADTGRRPLEIGYRFARRGDGVAQVTVDGAGSGLAVRTVSPTAVVVEDDGVARRYAVHQVGTTFYVDGPEGSSQLEEQERLPVAVDQVDEGAALAPMPGSVVRVAVAPGDAVEAGQLLVVLEAMKMEHAVHAGLAGRVTEVGVAEGDQVETGRILVTVEHAADGGPDAEGTVGP